MSAMFWQAILPLAATGSCAVLVMLLLQWVLRRVAGVVPSPAMLAALIYQVSFSATQRSSRDIAASSST